MELIRIPSHGPQALQPHLNTTCPLSSSHPDLLCGTQTLGQVCSHLRIPAFAVLPIRTTPPPSPQSCLSLNVTSSEGPSLKRPQQVSTHPSAHSNSQGSIYFLQTTYHHLKIICCMSIVRLHNLTPSLECHLPEGRDCLICSSLGSQHLELCPALRRGSINTCCLNYYQSHWHPHSKSQIGSCHSPA